MRNHFIVIGHVQGIGYRYFIQQNAKRFTLTGWVRNCSNGSVEGEVQGNETALKDFFLTIQTTHPLARVDQIIREAMNKINSEKNFQFNRNDG